MDGSKVWQAWQEGRSAEIRDYCETDAVNTYLVGSPLPLMRGEISASEYEQEQASVRAALQRLDKLHWHEFLAAWQ
jgi:predicted PolB exonuclease-like 3'-5' exonuclease